MLLGGEPGSLERCFLWPFFSCGHRGKGNWAGPAQLSLQTQSHNRTHRRALAYRGSPGGSGGKDSACNAGDPDSVPGLGRSPGEGNGNPLTLTYLTAYMGKDLKKSGHMYMHNRITLLYTWNQHNIDYQLYSTYKRKRKCMEWKAPRSTRLARKFVHHGETQTKCLASLVFRAQSRHSLCLSPAIHLFLCFLLVRPYFQCCHQTKLGSHCPLPRQEEKGTTEDAMVGWHHQLEGHAFEQAAGDGEGQGGLECCSPWGCRVGHDWTIELNCPLLVKLVYWHLVVGKESATFIARCQARDFPGGPMSNELPI